MSTLPAMPSKYDSLRDYLAAQPGEQIVRTIGELAKHVSGGLPPSAYRYQVWWNNEENTTHVQARSWMNAGWLVVDVDLAAEQVTLRRR